MNQLCNGKQIYRSEKESKRIRNGREKYGASNLRIYECPDCHGYHLTNDRFK